MEISNHILHLLMDQRLASISIERRHDLSMTSKLTSSGAWTRGLASTTTSASSILAKRRNYVHQPSPLAQKQRQLNECCKANHEKSNEIEMHL